MLIKPVQLYNSQLKDKVAVVSVESSSKGPDQFLVRVARGPSRGHLTGGTSYGPYPKSHLQPAFEQAVAALKNEGYSDFVGSIAVNDFTQAPGWRASALAALRLGRLQCTEAVPALLTALDKGGADACSIMDALGAIEAGVGADSAAIPKLREYAARKLLSRRRSAVEALRRIGDSEGLKDMEARAVARLPDGLRDEYCQLDPQDDSRSKVQALLQLVKKLPAKYQAYAVDSLYEMGRPLDVRVTQRLIRSHFQFNRVYVWRYIKSVFKRAMLRRDHKTFALIVHQIETKARHLAASSSEYKSGLDGKKRVSAIFHRKTRNYLRRLSGRYLKQLAQFEAPSYPYAAAEILCAYGEQDAQPIKGLLGPHSHCYMLYRVLWQRDKKFKLNNISLNFSLKSYSYKWTLKGKKRGCSYMELWDAQPKAWISVLAHSKLMFALELARQEVKKHAGVLAEASQAQLMAMLRSPLPEVPEMALGQLEARFDVTQPDWSLIDLTLAHKHPSARALGRRWLTLTAPIWGRDLERLLGLLCHKDGEARHAVAAAASGLFQSAQAEFDKMKEELGERILKILLSAELEEGAHDGCGQFAVAALLDVLEDKLSVSELLTLLEDGSAAAKNLAGHLLGRQANILEVLGLRGLIKLAENPVVSARASAHGMLRSAITELRRDPNALFMIVESQWPDTRDLAFELIKNEIPRADLGLEGIFALVDSTLTPVQNFGRELLLEDLDEFEPELIVSRLMEHPHRNMRAFTTQLILAVDRLVQGSAPLARLSPFFRACLFDLQPERAVKDKILAFVRERSLIDREHAEVAASLLNDFIYTDTQLDFDAIMESLVQIKMAYPDIDTPQLTIVSSAGASQEGSQ